MNADADVECAFKKVTVLDEEMVNVVSVKESTINNDSDAVKKGPSSVEKLLIDDTSMSDDDDLQIICVKNSNGKVFHDERFSADISFFKRPKKHTISPIALPFVLDEDVEQEDE